MSRLAVVVVMIALTLLASTPARAQAYFVPNFGYDFGGDAGNCPSLFQDCAEKRTSYGLTVGALTRVIGFEEDISYAPNFFGQATAAGANNVATYMSNLILAIPAGPVHPYVSAGVGLMRARLDFTLAGLTTAFSNNSFGYDIGGGVMILLPHHVGVRGDVRHLRSASDVTIAGVPLSDTKLSFMRASVGLVLH